MFIEEMIFFLNYFFFIIWNIEVDEFIEKIMFSGSL